MRIYVTLIVAFVFLMATSSCTRHTTCSAYGTSIKKIEKNQSEVHASNTVIEQSNNI